MEDKIRDIANFLIHSSDTPLTHRKQDWATRLVLRYTLLQIPALALIVISLILIQQWVELPAWFIWGFIIIWIIKDVALFPLTWRAFDWDHAGEAHSMIGRQGIVQEPLSPVGSVRVHGELWRGQANRWGITN